MLMQITYTILDFAKIVIFLLLTAFFLFFLLSLIYKIMVLLYLLSKMYCGSKTAKGRMIVSK